MRPADCGVLVRGGGDLATGVIVRLRRCGFPVVVTELAEPLTVRRTVAVSAAVGSASGTATVEGVTAREVPADRVDEILAAAEVPVVVSPGLPAIARHVVVDARLAKRNVDTTIADAPLVIALGPGFTAGQDCHAVIETNRGHHLGRVLWRGTAEPNTGTPGEIGGRSAERVLRAGAAGAVSWSVGIGDRVPAGPIGEVAGVPVIAPFAGVVRGLIAPGTVVRAGIKIGDVDPRFDVRVDEISDKALAIGGGVLEAVLTWMHRT